MVMLLQILAWLVLVLAGRLWCALLLVLVTVMVLVLLVLPTLAQVPVPVPVPVLVLVATGCSVPYVPTRLKAENG